jgi:outer membrane protein assembly factor BamB
LARVRQWQAVVQHYDGPIEALVPSTGAVIWTITLDSAWYDGFPTAYDGQLFLSGEAGAHAENTSYAINEMNGTVNWEAYGIQTEFSAPAIGDGFLFTSGFCDYAGLNPANGTQIWQDVAGVGGGGSIPVYYRHHVFIRDANGCGNLILDAATGTVQGKFFSKPPPAFFTQDKIPYMLTLDDFDGILSCTNLSTGRYVWSSRGDKYFDTAPVVVNNTVYEGSRMGAVYAFDKLTGTVRWTTNVGAVIGGYIDDQSSFSGGIAAGDGALVIPAVEQLSVYIPKRR